MTSISSHYAFYNSQGVGHLKLDKRQNQTLQYHTHRYSTGVSASDILCFDSCCLERSALSCRFGGYYIFGSSLLRLGVPFRLVPGLDDAYSPRI